MCIKRVTWKAREGLPAGLQGEASYTRVSKKNAKNVWFSL